MEDILNTAVVIRSVLEEAKAATVRDIATYFDVLDEEPITFAFILEAKRAAFAQLEQLRAAVARDIVVGLRRRGRDVSESGIRSYVTTFLVLRVKEHSR